MLKKVKNASSSRVYFTILTHHRLDNHSIFSVFQMIQFKNHMLYLKLLPMYKGLKYRKIFLSTFQKKSVNSLKLK